MVAPWWLWGGGAAPAAPTDPATAPVAFAPTYTVPRYDILTRNHRTLEYLGEINADRITGASWTREAYGGGAFSITIAREDVDLDTIPLHAIVEITRDGTTEFLGVLERRQIDPFGRIWTLSGVTLYQYWLSQRIVGATTAATWAGEAETVLLTALTAHLGSGAAANRQATAYIDVGFTIPDSSDRGSVIARSIRRRNLFDAAIEIAEEGDIIPSIVLSSGLDAYEVTVTTPTDATIASGAAPFGLDWDTVEELVYAEDTRELDTMVYVAGDGTGDSRNVTEVEHASMIGSHSRRELVIDAPYADTASERTAVGTYELARRADGIVTVRAKPHRTSGVARYRDDWDVGWDITFSESALRDEPIDIRVEAATVTLSAEQGEDIRFELGRKRPDSVLRRLEEVIRNLKASAND